MIESRIPIRRAAWSLASAALLVLLPAISQACSVCMGGAEEEVRKAFIVTTAFLSACPLLMVGALVWWLRRTLKAAAAANDAILPDGSPTSASALPATPSRGVV
ncbi:MAG: hypothetical protein JRG96_06865 [Deltaproteobacteria bacterium]|nr:hypothetical protein [Deltaproteobacteria bacterium]MBW2418628.1 hypothetical protein [Deltaproteobacteria bacterium]